MSIALRAALIPLLVGVPAFAAPIGNEARIQQANGEMTEFVLEQAQGGNHRLGGVAGHGSGSGLSFDAGAPAELSGDIRRLQVRQHGGPSAVGLDVDADVATIEITTRGDGVDTVLLRGRAADLTSRIETFGDGARTANLYVDALGETVVHELMLRGNGGLTVTVDQTTSATLMADLTSTAGPASANFSQSGSGAFADVMATLGSGAQLTLEQSAPGVQAFFTTQIGDLGSLTLRQTEPGNVFDSRTGQGPDVSMVGADHSVTITNPNP